MKVIFRHIFYTLIVVLCALVAVSCIYDRYPGTDEPATGGKDDNYLLVLRISPLDNSQVSAAADVTEKIKSLRVIVLGEKSIEYNKLITIDDPETVAASRFRYELTLPTTAGKKEIYLIANEHSVDKIYYHPAEDVFLPADLPTKFADLIKRYALTGSDLLPNLEPTPNPDEFRRVMSSIFLAPKYEADSDGAIYLPYTAVYPDIQAVKDKVNEIKMFLVPVATKIAFNFVNYRPAKVDIKNITVSSVNSWNFLMAHVGQKDYDKEFGQPGDADYGTYYWIDWLAKVSAASHSDEAKADNQAFNLKYGWIADYEIPAGDEPKPTVLVDGQDGSVPHIDEGDNVNEIPSTLTLGPYYIPESRNDVTYQRSYTDDTGQTVTETVTEQIYTLGLELHDQTQSEEKDPTYSLTISDLKAMFRNTHLIITVTIRPAGDLKIFATIASWNSKSVNGWVTEGPEPSVPLPDAFR